VFAPKPSVMLVPHPEQLLLTLTRDGGPAVAPQAVSVQPACQ
jgi:hypothetical protein